MTNFESAFQKVQILVDNFDQNYDHYMSAAYSEADARKDFIDKFFVALGWDVNHDTQTNPYEQEVKIERSQKQQNESARKRADYAFFFGPNFKDEVFFVEAKKPSVLIESNPQHYFQTIRYGWNAGCPICALTDFEEFIIVDCRQKPDIKYALNGQHQKFSYKDYTDKDKFGKIYWLFSREAIENNSIDKYASTLTKAKGKVIQKALFKGGYQEIDESFLEYLDAIRENLAKAFKKNNDALNSEQLTEAVQRTIDRLVFIRFLEDKFIESESHVNEWESWKDFVSDCRKLDVKYNGVVFKKHFIDEQDFAGAEEQLFIEICQDISSLNNPYLFNYIPIHILGSIYERFLGKIVIATAKRVHIDEKPEVRKAGGVYYTPKYIVQYIVQNTVGKLINGKTPKQISALRFADIACGSGSFLIGVYEVLLDYHKRYYTDKFAPKTEAILNEVRTKNKKGAILEDDGNIELVEGQWILTLKLKQEILLNNIYGVDIDAQAVEVSQLSLFLKMLEEETLNSTQQRTLFSKVLPDLSKNIVCGNSLVSFDIVNKYGSLFEDEEVKKLNPFDYKAAFSHVFRAGGFDCIVGNPPFIQLSSDPLLRKEVKKYLIDSYHSSMGRLNTFGFFTKRAFDLVGQNKMVGYIIPNTITTQDYYAELRAMILEGCRIESITNFDKLPFKDAVVENVILILEKESLKKVRQENLIKIIQVDAENVFNLRNEVEQVYFEKTPNKSFSINNNPLEESIKIKVAECSQPLGDYLEVNQAIALKSDRSKWVSSVKVNDTYKPLLIGGRNINRYFLEWDGTFLKYDLSGIHSCKREDIFLSEEKIFFRRVSNKLIATLDTRKFYGLHTLVVMNLLPKTKLDIKFFLGLFNSSLLNYIYKITFLSTKKVFTEIGARQVQQLPIRKIDVLNKDDKTIYNEIVRLVEQILQVKQKSLLAITDKDKSFLEHQFQSLDNQIDNLVFNLYGLSEEERKIVEENN